MLADPNDCSFQFNPTGTAKFTNSCDIAKATLARNSVSYTTEPAPAGSVAKVKVGDVIVDSYDATKLSGEAVKAAPAAFTKSINEALTKGGYPPADNPTKVKIPIDPKRASPTSRRCSMSSRRRS